MGWESATRKKRDALLACIPVHWRLSETELRQATADSDVRAALPVSCVFFSTFAFHCPHATARIPPSLRLTSTIKSMR